MLIVAAWLAILVGIAILTERNTRWVHQDPKCCGVDGAGYSGYPGPNHYHDCTL